MFYRSIQRSFLLSSRFLNFDPFSQKYLNVSNNDVRCYRMTRLIKSRHSTTTCTRPNLIICLDNKVTFINSRANAHTPFQNKDAHSTGEFNNLFDYLFQKNLKTFISFLIFFFVSSLLLKVFWKKCNIHMNAIETVYETGIPRYNIVTQNN